MASGGRSCSPCWPTGAAKRAWASGSGGGASAALPECGITADWQQVVCLVRGRHHRKTEFVPGFEAMVEGSGDGIEPSFLERAKARWGPSAGPVP